MCEGQLDYLFFFLRKRKTTLQPCPCASQMWGNVVLPSLQLCLPTAAFFYFLLTLQSNSQVIRLTAEFSLISPKLSRSSPNSVNLSGGKGRTQNGSMFPLPCTICWLEYSPTRCGPFPDFNTTIQIVKRCNRGTQPRREGKRWTKDLGGNRRFIKEARFNLQFY